MTAIQIIPTDFRAAPALMLLLQRRRAALVAQAPGAKADVLVVSAQREAALGGSKGLAELARGAGARTLVVVAEDAATFALQPEMGGRLLRVALPAAPAHLPPLLQSDLLALADVVGGLVSPMVAGDAATGTLIDLASRVARSDVTVFINGPTGSGKEVLARFIHAASRRAAGPFIAINCAAIPETMLEATLFGHEKGAFTGAANANKGLIRAADGGTLLLDEISEMPLALQSKLLRVLQERAVTPVGGQGEVPVDIRVIATSNRDMPAEVAANRFREDLYYRLNVFPLATRALADRPEDIAPIAVALLRRHARGIALPRLTPEALSALEAHRWPGNVRELENVIQRALVLCDGTHIAPEDVLIDAGSCLMPRQMLQQAV
ncbi:ATPase AAA [Gemmobacter lanyuensis]|uniref:Nif-specific regulatory protein n=1 Tax=Gemmobacter lanyuensis TaxID=1054497 RepID=A0A918IKV5_9RHOB|nr:sigma-54 dependent transcriptional regulator [Gemmobacter lanyuensis]GGW21429.1 ATPase AAA [Gemmobacter lanyuensis]